MTLAKKTNCSSNISGTWGGDIRKYNDLTTYTNTTKSVLDYIRTKQTAHHLLCDKTTLIPIDMIDEFIAMYLGYATQVNLSNNVNVYDTVKAHVRKFADSHHCSDNTMLICLKDIQNVMFALNTNKLAGSLTIDNRQQGDITVVVLG